MNATQSISPKDVPGLCTSVVAQDLSQQVWHGRNLDWNLPDVLLQMAVDIDFQRNQQTVFTASTIVGFVGVLHGMTLAQPAFSVSIDARDKGGKIIQNLLEALLFQQAMTPEQHLRRAFESQSDFPSALKNLSYGPLVNEVYYIVGGAKPGEGAVVSRDRDNVPLLNDPDVWALNLSDPEGWFRLQTNYDHWQPVPVADDRQHPGEASMESMGQANLRQDTLMTVMETWPVFNHHTDFTGIFNPSVGRWVSGVWLDPPSARK